MEDYVLIFEVIAWVGAFFFSICGIPQAHLAWKQGHSEGVSQFFMWSWFIGEVCMMIYSVYLLSLPLFVNYVLNFACLLVILHYKYFPRVKV